MQDPGNTQNYNRYSYCLNNPLKYGDPSGNINQNPLPRQETVDKEGFGSGSSWMNNFGETGYGGWGGIFGGTFGGSVSYGDGGSLTPHLDRDRQASNKQYAWRNAASNKSIANTTFVTLGFFYYDENGEPTIIDNFSGEFWLYEATEYTSFDNPSGQGGMTGLPENDFIKYSVAGTSVWTGTVQTGFETAKAMQPTVKAFTTGAKVLGRTSNFLGGISMAYDFGTGTANTSTLLNGAVMVGGAIVIGAVGIAAAPWVAGAGVVYGISSIFFEKPLNNAFDISKTINFVEPRK